jgi:hypothetical protein
MNFTLNTLALDASDVRMAQSIVRILLHHRPRAVQSPNPLSSRTCYQTPEKATVPGEARQICNAPMNSGHAPTK